MSTPIPNGGAATFPLGYAAAGLSCGIKSSGKADLAIVKSDVPATVAAVFTANKVVAAPVMLSRRQLAESDTCQAIVINSGNANACTGKAGMSDARAMVEALAESLEIKPDQCLVASTGVIGERLPMDKILPGIAEAALELARENGGDAARAILTTDAFTKEVVAEIAVGASSVRIGGMAKGAGMIAPVLVPHATMIAVITTDAAVSSTFLRTSLAKAMAGSFNACSVDGDTSTNDSVFLLANGASGCRFDEDTDSALSDLFVQALSGVCTELAKMIVKDGEGSTKLITYKVSGAANESEAMAAAMAMAKSLLVKTAFFGQDPNWGRLLAAAGYSGAAIDVAKTCLSIGGVQLVRFGEPLAVNVDDAARAMKADEIEVELQLGVGSAGAVFYGCDLPHEYVRINSEYHT